MQSLSRLVPHLLVVLVVLTIPWLFPARSITTPVAEESNAWLEERYGIRILHLSGSPYEMGYDHGRLLREEIRRLIQNRLYGKLIPNSPYPYPLLLAYARLIDNHLPREYRREMQGIADAADVSYLDLVLWNAISELALFPDQRQVVRELISSPDIWWPPSPNQNVITLPLGKASDNFAETPPPLNLSIIIFGQATADGELLHGISWSEPVAIADLLVIIYEPAGEDAFVSFSWPGFVGVMAGMNEEKISVLGMGWPSLDASPQGVPTPFLLRQVLEESGDIPSAVEILASAERTSGYTILIGDGKPADAAALEFTARRWRLVPADLDYLVRGGWPLDTEISELRTDPEMNSLPVMRFQHLVAEIEGQRGQLDINSALGLAEVDAEAGADPAITAMVFAASDWGVWVELTGPQGKRRVMLLDLLQGLVK